MLDESIHHHPLDTAQDWIGLLQDNPEHFFSSFAAQPNVRLRRDLETYLKEEITQHPDTTQNLAEIYISSFIKNKSSQFLSMTKPFFAILFGDEAQLPQSVRLAFFDEIVPEAGAECDYTDQDENWESFIVSHFLQGETTKTQVLDALMTTLAKKGVDSDSLYILSTFFQKLVRQNKYLSEIEQILTTTDITDQISNTIFDLYAIYYKSAPNPTVATHYLYHLLRANGFSDEIIGLFNTFMDMPTFFEDSFIIAHNNSADEAIWLTKKWSTADKYAFISRYLAERHADELGESLPDEIRCLFAIKIYRKIHHEGEVSSLNLRKDIYPQCEEFCQQVYTEMQTILKTDEHILQKKLGHSYGIEVEVFLGTENKLPLVDGRDDYDITLFFGFGKDRDEAHEFSFPASQSTLVQIALIRELKQLGFIRRSVLNKHDSTYSLHITRSFPQLKNRAALDRLDEYLEKSSILLAGLLSTEQRLKDNAYGSITKSKDPQQTNQYGPKILRERRPFDFAGHNEIALLLLIPWLDEVFLAYETSQQTTDLEDPKIIALAEIYPQLLTILDKVELSQDKAREHPTQVIRIFRQQHRALIPSMIHQLTLIKKSVMKIVKGKTTPNT